MIKQTEKDFARALENCIRNGIVLLVEDIGEILDPVLDPVLEKDYIVQGPGRFAIRLG